MDCNGVRSDQRFDLMLDAVRRIAVEVAAPNAADVDRQARFPSETLAALRQDGLLSAAVPQTLGGAGCTMVELAQLCSALSQACGSSGMVLAMHYIQLAAIARHAAHEPFFKDYLCELVQRQYLLASITSEVGTYGDTRSSLCAIERRGERFVLNKEATTGSYCANADAILVTCKRDAEAAKSDQILVLVKSGDYTLTQTTTWDTMGMRGTVSPGFRLESNAPLQQVLPCPFADIAAQSMVPFSHILWSSLWWGIAADAVGKAAAFVRGQARQSPGTVPATAGALADVSMRLQNMKQLWLAAAQAFDDLPADVAGQEQLMTMGWALRCNNVKISCSEATPQIVHQALQIVGILGYKNDSPYSLSRQYRDALSGSLMISNERINAKSASMMLVFKDAP